MSSGQRKPAGCPTFSSTVWVPGRELMMSGLPSEPLVWAGESNAQWKLLGGWAPLPDFLTPSSAVLGSRDSNIHLQHCRRSSGTTGVPCYPHFRTELRT